MQAALEGWGESPLDEYFFLKKKSCDTECLNLTQSSTCGPPMCKIEST